MDLRNAVYALGLKGAVINAGAVACPLKSGIRQLLPPLAQVIDGVFLSHVTGHVVGYEIKLSRLITKASALYAIRRGQDVRVRIALCALLAVWRMDCHVSGNTVGIRDALRKFDGKGFAFFWCKFNGQGDSKFTGDLCICSFVFGLYRVPDFSTFWLPF